MILIISIELRKKQAHKQIDDTLESCNMHMYGQKFFNTYGAFPWNAKIDLGLGTRNDLQ